MCESPGDYPCQRAPTRMRVQHMDGLKPRLCGWLLCIQGVIFRIRLGKRHGWLRLFCGWGGWALGARRGLRPLGGGVAHVGHDPLQPGAEAVAPDADGILQCAAGFGDLPVVGEAASTKNILLEGVEDRLVDLVEGLAIGLVLELADGGRQKIAHLEQVALGAGSRRGVEIVQVGEVLDPILGILILKQLHPGDVAVAHLQPTQGVDPDTLPGESGQIDCVPTADALAAGFPQFRHDLLKQLLWRVNKRGGVPFPDAGVDFRRKHFQQLGEDDSLHGIVSGKDVSSEARGVARSGVERAGE